MPDRTIADIDRDISRDLEREPSAFRRLRIPLLASGTVKARFVRLHPSSCDCPGCQAFDRVDWGDTLVTEVGADERWRPGDES